MHRGIYTPGWKILHILTTSVGAYFLSFSPACAEGKASGPVCQKVELRTSAGTVADLSSSPWQGEFCQNQMNTGFSLPFCHPWVWLGPASAFPFSVVRSCSLPWVSPGRGARAKASSETPTQCQELLFSLQSEV